MSSHGHATGKKLLFVTGTRADFSKLEPLARAAQDAGFLISFFITGMHMMKRYGETRFEVRRFPNADFFEFVNQREGDALDFVLSKTILGFSDFVHEHRPDLIIIHGDRIEALAASIVCAFRCILSAHIEGGEVSGSIDESIRHCSTKLCSVHFVSSDAARQRVLSMGESSEAVYAIGSPELDMHSRPSGVTIEEVKERYDIQFSDYGIVAFHSVLSEIDTIRRQAEALFGTLEASGRSFVVVLPNNDPGTEDIISVLEKLPKERFKVIPSMRFKYFSELMRNASIMIGNSSAGVREAPFLGLPSINIGTRQNNRCSSSSVAHCLAFEAGVIDSLLMEMWGRAYPRESQFGTGIASRSFIEVLTKPDFWIRPSQKVFAD